jgi:hypothetical protein
VLALTCSETLSTVLTSGPTKENKAVATVNTTASAWNPSIVTSLKP